jgi:enoyl-CoA hydratase/carnithine racemase
MPYKTVRCEVDESILTITLNRPDTFNAFTKQMLHEMIDAFDRADKDDAVRAVIVTGAGRAFCAGADLSGGGATFDRASRTDRPQIPLGPDGEYPFMPHVTRNRASVCNHSPIIRARCSRSFGQVFGKQ